MPRSRDRHDRGVHGPVALPDSDNRKTVPLHSLSRVEYFDQCVKQTLATIAGVDPHAPDDMVVGVKDVPLLETTWSGDQVPISAALKSSKDRPVQIVIYQHPLEHRANSRSALRSPVHRTTVEQLNALTDRPVGELLGYGPTDWEDWNPRRFHGMGVFSEPPRPKRFRGIPPVESFSPSSRIGDRAPSSPAPAE